MQKYLVNVSVTNLRREPIDIRFWKEKDSLQESQLLFNEKLIGLKANYGWVFVEAIEQQKCYADGEWRGYSGWVKADHLIEVRQFDAENICVRQCWASIYSEPDQKSRVLCDVSLGTYLHGFKEIDGFWLIKTPDGADGAILSSAVRNLFSSPQDAGQGVIQLGKNFLHFPYLWGGRSAYRKNDPFTSVDCSGFVQLLYRVFGIQLPRDAHDQFLKCVRRESHQLKVGDFVCLADVEKPLKVNHIMLYAGDDLWIEAVMQAKKVRLISTEEKLGASLAELKWGCRNKQHRIFFGSPMPQFEELLIHSAKDKELFLTI